MHSTQENVIKTITVQNEVLSPTLLHSQLSEPKSEHTDGHQK